MPFKLGPAPIRRTLGYLKDGRLIFKDRVKVFGMHFYEKRERRIGGKAIEDENDPHKGLRDFMFWHLGQICFKNPDVHVMFLKNHFPNPFIRVWFDNGDDILIDVFDKNHMQIMDYLVKILGKKDVLSKQQSESTEHKSSANFGSGCLRHCMCEVMGQVPCSGLVRLPAHMTGKYQYEHGLLKKRIR